MPYLENEESILDSSTASRSFSFLVCEIIASSFNFSCSISFIFCLCAASLSSVPLKAEISHESRCPQSEGQEAPSEDGKGDELDGGGVEVAIESEEGRNGIKEGGQGTGQ
jgi:hypothetical protein